jgi:WD40 repeat protein/DNA-binding SARP family transcriptional activator
MARLSLSLLGPFQATLDGQPIANFESNKVRALLAYLVAESDRPHARETLAGLLWPDYPDRSALNNLRSALANLRQAIGDRDANPPFLLITREDIQFNRDSDCVVDVATFRDLPQQPIAELEQCLVLYHGAFLDGFSLADSPAFEEWARDRREQIKLDVLAALRRLAEHYEADAAYEQAVAVARRALALEPWDEAAHRQVMRALAFSGQRSLALAHFETCDRLLQAELGIGASPETMTLAEAIRHDTLLPPAPSTGRCGGAAPAPGEPPYKGMAFFDEADADVFCGREALIAQLVGQVLKCLTDEDGGRLLAVIGASGSGKSSIVRAGLIPALRPIFADAVHVITPTAQPLQTLALSLVRTEASVVAAATLADDLAADPRSLHLAACRLSPPGAARLLLVVDQMEELFTQCRDEPARRAFVDNLLYAVATPGPTVVVLALRADFYAQCAPFPALRQALSQRQHFIGGMSSAELRQAIEQPAQRGAWAFEPGLVDLLLREVGDAPGALPLLSHALLETWRRREGRVLTLAGYEAAGGVRGAIAQTAETTFTILTAAQQALARNVFLRLTEVGEDAADKDVMPFYARRRASLAELTPGPDAVALTQAVLTRLADARLISIGQDTVEVAHEALIQEWGRLRGWLAENRAGLRLHRHLTESAEEWARMGEDAGGLYRGARLAQASEWAAEHAGELNLTERHFLAASETEAAAQARAEAERRRRELVAARALAEEQRRRAEAEKLRAETQAWAATSLRRRALTLSLATGGLVILLAAALWLAQARQTQARLAVSRELAAAAVNSLQVDPERGVLLGLQAVANADTLEARNALHQALPELHSLLTIAAHGPGGAPGVAYAPDGARLASIGVDNTVKLWDAATGELLRTLTTPEGDVGGDVAFSPDGKLLAASVASQVLVWDAATGEQRWSLPGRMAGAVQVDRIAISSDNRRLAAANVEGQPKVWDLTTGRELFTLRGHADHCEAIAFSPDGKWLATGDVVGGVRLWDAVTGQLLSTLTHGGLVHGVAFSPDGRQLAAAGEDGRLLVWDTTTAAVLLSLPGRSGLYDVAYLPDGERFVTVHQDGTTAIWDAATGQPLLTLAGHLSTVISVAASPDNVHIATSGYDSTVRVWDTRPGSELMTLTAHGAPAYDIAYSPDGTRLATAGADGAARLWDAATGLLALSLFPDASAPGFASIVFSPDGRRVAAGGVDGTVLVGDVVTGKTELALTGHTDMVWGLAFSPDGQRLTATSWDGTARVWDLTDGHEMATFRRDEPVMLFGVAFSPDGQRVFTTYSNTVREWDAATGEEVNVFPGEGLDVYGVALSPDGQRLAVGRQDGSVVVFDVASGKKLLQLTGHGGLVLRMAFSQDSGRLATASFDKFAKVWDAHTGKELATFYGNGGNVFGVALSPDGRRLATAGGDGTVRLFTLDVAELTDLARTRVPRSLTTAECQRYLHVTACP